jgi:hypothetical protein
VRGPTALAARAPPGARSGMRRRTADEERRSGIHWTVIGLVAMVAALGMWWLVENTNKEGEHDAELLPLFALIPLAIGIYRWAHSRGAA